MTKREKRSILTYLLKNPNLSYISYANYLDKIGILKRDYEEYTTTVPINLDLELSKRYNADFDTICALLAAVLKEAEMVHEKFKERISKGIVNDLIIRILVESYICGKTPTYRFYFHIISLRLLAYGFDYKEILKFMHRNEEIVKESFAYSRLAYNEKLISEKDFRLGGVDELPQILSELMHQEKQEQMYNQYMKEKTFNTLQYI